MNACKRRCLKNSQTSYIYRQLQGGGRKPKNKKKKYYRMYHAFFCLSIRVVFNSTLRITQCNDVYGNDYKAARWLKLWHNFGDFRYLLHYTMHGAQGLYILGYHTRCHSTHPAVTGTFWNIMERSSFDHLPDIPSPAKPDIHMPKLEKSLGSPWEIQTRRRGS